MLVELSSERMENYLRTYFIIYSCKDLSVKLNKRVAARPRNSHLDNKNYQTLGKQKKADLLMRQQKKRKITVTRFICFYYSRSDLRVLIP